ncbi:hypothetical protein KUTeg_007678 [Tegillarca granosa]|uniref:Uncharacterized protein n=1 Tax=Tegillarca granosa TaxID=220873 RepID=A0ABQ9FDX4_TEGGR|nr:hypothetical protein KUTeg_007678 [Tegillarca granosa]
MISETPIIQENPTYRQNSLVKKENDSTKSVSSLNPVVPCHDDPDYSLANLKRKHSETVMEPTISNAFSGASPERKPPFDSNDSPENPSSKPSSSYLVKKESDNETENNSIPDYVNSGFDTSFCEYQKQTTDYQPEAPTPVVREEKGVQTEPTDQRESITSKPKETGEGRKKQQDTADNDYDYVSFINLIKNAVQTSLRKKAGLDLHRTTSAMPSQQKPKCLFNFPERSGAHPVVRSVSVKDSRPQERLPMPLKKQQNSFEYEHDEISYFRKASSTPAICPGYETADNPDSSTSPPYIDPNQLNPRVQQQHQDDSDDSDDDLMDMDDDFKDYVSTLKKQVPHTKAEQTAKNMCDSNHMGPSTESLLSDQITVEIRKGDEKLSSGRKRSSSFICIELSNNILSRLEHRNQRDGSFPETENEDESNEVYMEMGRNHIYGNVDQEEDYLPMATMILNVDAEV